LFHERPRAHRARLELAPACFELGECLLGLGGDHQIPAGLRELVGQRFELGCVPVIPGVASALGAVERVPAAPDRIFGERSRLGGGLELGELGFGCRTVVHRGLGVREPGVADQRQKGCGSRYHEHKKPRGFREVKLRGQASRARTEAALYARAGAPMTVPKRASWDEYFMAIAREVATRSTCDRKHVGAVIVRDRMILATGYNGSIRGLGHCDDEGHLMEDGHCVRTVHAEANAIVQAARNGMRVEGGDIYITASPCFGCFKLIANAGLKRIAFGEFYRDHRIYEFSEKLGIQLEHLQLGEVRA
jgi:dCMP deaminase